MSESTTVPEPGSKIAPNTSRSIIVRKSDQTTRKFVPFEATDGVVCACGADEITIPDRSCTLRVPAGELKTRVAMMSWVPPRSSSQTTRSWAGDVDGGRYATAGCFWLPTATLICTPDGSWTTPVVLTLVP